MNTGNIKIGLVLISAGAGLFFLLRGPAEKQNSPADSASKANKTQLADKLENKHNIKKKKNPKKLVNGLLRAINEREARDMSVEDTDCEPNVRNLSPVELAANAIRNSAISEQFLGRARDLLDRMLADQKKDAVWTDAVRRRLDTLMKNLPDKQAGTVKEATCYETMCKIVTVHDSMESVKKFHIQAIEYDELGGPGHRFAKKNGKNITNTRYMARVGDDEAVHDAVYNKMYEEITGKSAKSIVPTTEQINEISGSMGEI